MDLSEGNSFDSLFRGFTERTCMKCGYTLPDDQFYLDVYARLPEGLRQTISHGFSKGIVHDVGLSKTGSAGFRPCSVPDSKGPYSWFDRDNVKKQPRPTWEYYIQVAEYIRLFEALKDKGYELTFEDRSMDIGIYKNGTLIVYCEIKEKSSQAESLVGRIRKYEHAEELPREDRGDDPLRKAKYISTLKPAFFYVVSIGRRFEYRVEYPERMQFRLVEDLIPFI